MVSEVMVLWIGGPRQNKFTNSKCMDMMYNNSQKIRVWEYYELKRYQVNLSEIASLEK